jgi:hypothetical protein
MGAGFLFVCLVLFWFGFGWGGLFGLAWIELYWIELIRHNPFAVSSLSLSGSVSP